MNDSQKEALYGPAASHSEHRPGDTIHIQYGIQIKTGKILHVRAPGQAIVEGREHPLLYIVDCNEGMPIAVLPSQIVADRQGAAQPIIAIIASYGYPRSKLQSREQAESFAVNVQGYVIAEQDGRRLKVLNAHVGGNERQGDVIATCEAVEEGQGPS